MVLRQKKSDFWEYFQTIHNFSLIWGHNLIKKTDFLKIIVNLEPKALIFDISRRTISLKKIQDFVKIINPGYSHKYFVKGQ